jgi:hypothetical protein
VRCNYLLPYMPYDVATLTLSILSLELQKNLMVDMTTLLVFCSYSSSGEVSQLARELPDRVSIKIAHTTPLTKHLWFKKFGNLMATFHGS